MATEAGNQDDFFEWAFEQSGRNPLAWQHSAKDLLQAADAVSARVHDVSGDLMHSLAAVQAMLMGLAIECLLKGIWIKKHRAWTEENKEHGLTKAGRYVGIPGAGDHELKQLADAAKVKVSEDEQGVLQRLSGFVKFAGRYPIPTTWRQMKPAAAGSGSKVAPRFFSVVEFELADNLAKRLMDEVVPWKVN